MGYRFVVSADGIDWISECLGVPWKKRRYLLDAKLDLYQSWEADGPEGLEVVPLWGWGEESSGCIGWPSREATLRREYARVNEAIAVERAKIPPCPQTLRFATTPCLNDSRLFDQRDLARASGRLRRARLTRLVTAGKLDLPPGSELDFNCDEWMDPRRADRLVSATLSASALLPMRERPRAQPGARITFDAKGCPSAATRAFDGVLRLQGIPVDGYESIGWHEDGSISHCILGAKLCVGALEFPRGTRVSPWYLDLHRRQHFLSPPAGVATTHGVASSVVVDYDLRHVVGAMIDDRWVRFSGCSHR